MYHHPTTKSAETAPLLPLPLPKGEYHPPTPTDLRSPCPVVNSLANHGYIARSGRDIRASDLRSAMSVLGVSFPLRQLLTSVTYLEHRDPSPSPHASWGFLAFLLHPLAYILGHFGVRSKNQVDALGAPCLNLDDLSLHNAIEHDVSMSRRDFLQGDNHTSQADLVAEMLSSSSPSPYSSTSSTSSGEREELTLTSFAHLRVRRIAEQRASNPSLDFGGQQNRLGLAEAALVQRVFGDEGREWAVPVQYVEALFGEERLPVREGWRKRSWWEGSVGIIEMTVQALRFGRAVEGVQVKA